MNECINNDNELRKSEEDGPRENIMDVVIGGNSRRFEKLHWGPGGGAYEFLREVSATSRPIEN